jgi:hypothetical protein
VLLSKSPFATLYRLLLAFSLGTRDFLVRTCGLRPLVCQIGN